MHPKLKNLSLFLFLILCSFACNSCSDKDTENDRWEIEQDLPEVSFAFADISKGLFDSDMPIQELRNKYPLFFSNNRTDSIYEEIRRDSLLKAVYHDQKVVFGDYSILKKELNSAFQRIKYFYPNWEVPNIYVYSSDLSSLYDPILYIPEEKSIYIALDGFLGSNNEWYKKAGIEKYLADGMTPLNVLPKTVDAIARKLIPTQKEAFFLASMIQEGKVLLFKDAVLPNTLDSIKIGYSSKAYSWCFKQEYYIWNYFIQADLLYDSDKDLINRFLSAGPFSKFYNEIQTESPSRIGEWIGWQIVRKYAKENKDLSLSEILNQSNHEKIFIDSHYKPKE